MMNKNKKETLLNKAVLTMNGAELLELLQQAESAGVKEEIQQSSLNYSEKHRLVTGIKGLARELNVSTSTISRWKAEGVLDDVTFQAGKSVIFDVHGVLEKLRVSNKN